MIERLDGMPAGTYGFRFTGKVSRRDYEDVLIPGLREAVERGEVRCLCQLGPGFDGYEAGAAWEDLKTGAQLGVGHHSAWRRMAVATDVDWVRHAMGVFRWMVPGELRLFELDEVDEARAWVAA